jgi:flagellar biosynthetic protein FliP
MKAKALRWLWLAGLLGLPLGALAAPDFAALKISPPSADGSQTYSVTLQVLGFMTAMTFLPLALMMMTSFTRIIIVLAILRQALGTMSTPSNQILLGLSLFLTVFIMMPVFDKAYDQGLKP